MNETVNGQTVASPGSRSVRFWAWMWRVLDASVIEVREGHYVGSI